MRSYTCVRCGHELVTSGIPASQNWSDNHVCAFKPTAEYVLEQACTKRLGFLTQADVDALAQDEQCRLQPCLIRFHGCRLTCPAQDVKHIIDALEKAEDWCRDVCVPASDPIWKALGLR